MSASTYDLAKKQLIKAHARYDKSMRGSWAFNESLRKKYNDDFGLFKQQIAQELTDKLALLDKEHEPKVEEAAKQAEVPTITDTFEWYYSKWTVELKPFQSSTVSKKWNKLMVEDKAALLVPGATGVGKTYMTCAFISRLQEEKWHEKIKTLAPWPYLIVTKAAVVEQFTNVARYCFGLDMRLMCITNYDQLRSTFGEMFLREETRVKDGEPYIHYIWRKWMNPMFVVWDECHSLKNEDSLQHRIGAAYNDVMDANIKQIFMSATPATRVIDLKNFVVATKRNIV